MSVKRLEAIPMEEENKMNPGIGMDNRSNTSVDWAGIYDTYEVRMRDAYRTAAKAQNESHFELLKRYLKKEVPQKLNSSSEDR